MPKCCLLICYSSSQGVGGLVLRAWGVGGLTEFCLFTNSTSLSLTISSIYGPSNLKLIGKIVEPMTDLKDRTNKQMKKASNL